MNFANLTPAERMKASGLIGLIVVVVFFVVYTMMGTLGGKKTSSAPAPPAPDQTASSAVSGPLGSDPGTAVNPDGQPFPIGDAKSHQASAQDQELYDIGDPFRPIRGKPKPTPAAISAMNHGQPPNVGIMPANQQRPLPVWGQSSRGPAQFGANPFARQLGGTEPEKADPPKYMPEIQVVGVVHGSPSVATLRVEGHVITARPGDLIAKGHRLVTVNDEGVVLRAHGELTSLRVGAGVNNSKAAQQAEG